MFKTIQFYYGILAELKRWISTSNKEIFSLESMFEGTGITKALILAIKMFICPL